MNQKIENMYKDMVFYNLQENLETSMAKKLVNTGISSAKKFSKSKYGKEIKKQGIKFAKTIGKRTLKKLLNQLEI